jgi:hypothetical protein
VPEGVIRVRRRLTFLSAALSASLLLLGTPDLRAGPSVDSATMLAAHNAYRKTQCAPPLTWSPQLAAAAQDWANKCSFAHSPGAWQSADGYGENLYWGSGPVGDAGHAVKSWYDEVSSYDLASPTWSTAVGHFTQVVWKGSRQVGCGVALCGDKNYWVCRYSPTGNWNAKQQAVLVANVGCTPSGQKDILRKPISPGKIDALRKVYQNQKH